MDVLGLTFRKDLFLSNEQIFPIKEDNSSRQLTRLQERLIKKLGANAYPFYFELPPHCPASVTLQPAQGDTGKPCGVDYELKAYVAETQEEKPHKRNSVRLAIRKVVYAPGKQGDQPCVEVSKDFVMSPNKLHLEASLDKEVYHHGEDIVVNVHIANNSNRTVKKIKVSVRQFADICLFSTAQYKCCVAEVESEYVCMYTNRVIGLTGLIPFSQRRLSSGTWIHTFQSVLPQTVAGKQQGQKRTGTGRPVEAWRHKLGLLHSVRLQLHCSLYWVTYLTISYRINENSQKENLGIIVQYKVKVKLCLGPLGGDLVAELPFILMHPKPEEVKMSDKTISSCKLQENSDPQVASLIQLE